MAFSAPPARDWAGALVLGAAGLLRGYKATGHWYIRDLLSLLGATPVNARASLLRSRAPAISAAREKAARIGARLGS